MSLEEKIFKKAQIKIDKLMSYGFKEINNSYIYSKKILNNTFKIQFQNFLGKKIPIMEYLDTLIIRSGML